MLLSLCWQLISVNSEQAAPFRSSLSRFALFGNAYLPRYLGKLFEIFKGNYDMGVF